MPIDLISKIKPKNNGSFPVFEDIDCYGGYQVREDIDDRDSIPSLSRKEGMLVFVQNDGYYYTLEGGIENTNWIRVNFSGEEFIVGGDIIGVSGNQKVIKIQGYSINNIHPTDGYILVWKQHDGYWAPDIKNISIIIDKTPILSDIFVHKSEEIVLCNPDSDRDVYLPNNPYDGERHTIIDGYGTASAHQGINIYEALDLPELYIICRAYGAVSFVWSSSLQKWFITSEYAP